MFIIPTSRYVNYFKSTMSRDTLQKPIFICRIPVRWGDMDAYHHINNAMYLRYMEEARIQLLYQAGIKMDGRGLGPVIVNASCTFLLPVTYPDTLVIECYIGDPGRSSFMSYYKLYSQSQQDRLVCEGSAKIVWIDPAENKSVPLPAKILDIIQSQSLPNT